MSIRSASRTFSFGSNLKTLLLGQDFCKVAFWATFRAAAKNNREKRVRCPSASSFLSPPPLPLLPFLSRSPSPSPPLPPPPSPNPTSPLKTTSYPPFLLFPPLPSSPLSPNQPPAKPQLNPPSLPSPPLPPPPPQVPSEPTPFSVGDLRRAIPKHCFERSLLKSSAYLLADLLAAAALYCAASSLASPALGLPAWLRYGLVWPVYWFLQGAVCTGLW